MIWRRDQVRACLAAVERGKGGFCRLVLLVGEGGVGKSRALGAIGASFGVAPVNVNLAMAELLLEVEGDKRALQARRGFFAIVDEGAGGALLLDRTEILFDVALLLDPLALLREAARSRLVVAAWRGAVGDGELVYADKGHPEYRVYRVRGGVDAMLVDFNGRREAAAV